MSLSDRLSSLSPTQRELFELLRKKNVRPARPEPPPLVRRPPAPPGDDAWPLTADQERLWFLYQLDPADSSYNIPMATSLLGAVAPGALARALTEIVRRHEAWRTTFPTRDGSPVQVVHPPAPVPMPVIDLSGLPEERRAAEAGRVIVEEVRRPFDLEQGPLLRCSLIRREPEIHDWSLTAHHIVTDWYSSQIFWGELAALYPALVAGRPVALPDPPVQYADFAVWQRACLSGEALREHLDYWTSHLAGAPLALELPTDRPRPVHFTTRGRRIRMALSPARSEGIKTYARRHRATPFMVVLGLLQTLLARASGQDRVIVASPNVNRARPELQQLLGFFITQLAYCTDLGGDPTFAQLTDRVRQVALGALAHQDLPFGKLVEALRPERDTSRPPVAQVTLLLLEAAMASSFPDLGGLRMKEMSLDPEASSSELTLALWDSPAGFQGHLEFNVDLFDTTTVARLADGFVSLLDAVVAGAADSDAPLSALPVQSEAAAHQVLREWNDTRLTEEAEPVPVHKPVHQIIAAQSGRTPEAVALVDGEERWTYRELAARATELAARLRRMGVGPEARVAVCLPRSGELVASLLGILSSGAAYVPLDPAYPRERLRFMLEDCGAAALVTRPELEPLLPDLPVPRVAPPSPGPSPAERERDGEGGEGAPEHLAYLIYTSGSTGRPKAVGVRHHNLSTFVSWAGELFADELAGGVLFSTSVCFDLSVFEIFGTLAHGGTLILAENALALTEIPAAGEVGLINTVPSAMAELLRLAERLPPSVRAVSLCGEPFSRRLADDIQARGIGRAINLYGPSEDTVYSTWALVPHGEELEPAIGRPITGTQAYVLDRGLWPVPMGARGELYLAGDGLARGYMGRPDLTADRFVPDPFADRPGGRMYRTGDLSRWRSGGALEFLGRIDRQVKVRGFRIELGEIEAVLASLPGVADVAVVVRDGRLAAYLVPGPEVDGEALVETARNAVLDRLPRHMAPALWASLPALPHTPNGKVDHKALPAPEALDGGSGAEAAPPRTPAEQALATIWSEVLGLPGVGVHDNFFRLGGDSILSIRVVARARQAGLILTPRQIFERQTVAELAAAAAPIDTTAPTVETGLVTGTAPLTPIQRWFLEARPADPHHFNQAVLLETRTPVEDRELRRAVAALLEHHDALRLRFSEDGPALFSPPPAEPPVTRADLSAIPAEQRRSVLEAAASLAQESLDLAHGPLLRAVFFDLGAGSPGRLLLVIHHLVVDGVSWRILLEDLRSFPALPARTTSWQRWAEQLTEHARSAAVRDEAAFWLAQPEPEPLPVDHSSGNGEDTEASADTVSVTLPAEATRALLRDAAAAYHGRPDDLLLTAVARAFASWTGSPRLVLWLEGHGREEALPGLPAMDLSRTVGWFTSLFPVALDLLGVSDPGAAIRRIKETLREIPSGGIGFGLLRWLGNEDTATTLAARRQPEVVFNHLGRLDLVLGDDSPYAPAPESSGWPRSPRALRRHRLEINAAVVGGRLEVHWTYGRNVHERATIERLARRFASELEALIAHCLAPGAGGWTPSDFPLARLGQAALDRLAGNDPRVEDIYPLSPMQAGLLFHGLYAPATEIYFEQISCTIRGDLDTAAFHRAWQRVVDRHGILRTAFAWEGLEQPLQVVRRGVEIPWVEADWQDVGETGAADAQLAAFAAADRQRPFSPGRAPLLRAALLRTGESTHRFVWSFHHLLIDGWSLPPLFQEVFTLYEAERTTPGGADPLPPPLLTYRDFVAWLARRDHAADERYWRQALAGITGPTPLPWDSAAPPVAAKADDFAQHQTALSEEITAALDTFARERGMTLNTVVQGAWAILLSRWSGEREVVFGAVTSGRPPELPGFETAIGLFINTLPVRRAVDPEAPLAAWLADLQRTQIEARQHEHAPLAEVQRWSAVPAREPLFQSLLVFENYPLDETVSERLGGLQLDAVDAVERTSFPLSLAVVPGRRLRLRITHDGRLAPASGELLLSWLQRLLEGFAATPERPLAGFDLLSEAEREQIRGEHEEAARPHAIEDSLARFERRAAETPDAPAVRDAAGTLTFAELDRRAARLARALRETGVGPESRVALAVGRSAGLLAGILGIWKAGAAWVPLDPAHPRERTAAILRVSEAAALVTSREALDLLPPGLPPVVGLEDTDGPEDAAQPSPLPLLPERAAYVLYTSGSTGDPKGVVIDHAALAGYLAWVDEALLGPVGFALPATSALTFDASLKQLLGPLLAGREVRILPEETATQPLALATALAAERFAAFNGVPALWSALLDLVESGNAPAPDALQRVLLGGEALSPELVERTRRLLPGVLPGIEVWNLYGPTEATANATAARIAPGDRVDAITIGRPLPGVRVVVLDRDGRPVPAGASGELCLGGGGLARGYLGRPDLTAERFIPNPFSAIPGDRLYRTGDLVRRRLDGLLEHRGRIDLQVKVRGIRIELGEIEAVLRRHPAVREAVVTVRPPGSNTRPGDARLDAWIAAEPSIQITAADLRIWLRERLPPAAVPADLTLLPELPRLPNGKVDRRALAARAPEGESGGRPYIAPANDVEEKLAGLWSDLLGTERVGRGDNFFELGGHSLLATQLMVRIRASFSVDLPLPAIFEAEDLAALAQQILALRLSDENPEDLARLMAELDSLSDDEVESLLGEEDQP